MHKYMTAVGFSALTRKELDEIIQDVVEHPQKKCISRTSEGDSFVEFSKDFADNMGIAVRGINDENDDFIYEYYYPYLKGNELTTKESIEIEKHSDREAYAGVCDDMHLGVTLVFYLQNVTDYLDRKEKGKEVSDQWQERDDLNTKRELLNKLWVKQQESAKPQKAEIQEVYGQQVTGTEKNKKRRRNQIETTFRNGAKLAALSTEGKILLPIADLAKVRKTAYRFNEKSKQASDNSIEIEDFMESIESMEMDTYDMISRRVEQNEDIFSIVSSTFMPDGIETDHYSILGEILEYKPITNVYSKEIIYWMKISCNGLKFEICINENDLLGVPEEGRRFKGNIWMQGVACL